MALNAQQSLVIDTRNDCLVLDSYVNIITDLSPNELYKVTVTANDVNAPMQGLFFMYQDANEGVKFRYVDDGESFNFVPISATRKIAPLYVDWSTTSDNSGTITIDFQGPTTKSVTIDVKNDALLLDDLTTIVTDLEPSTPYTVNVIDDNINAPMHGLFFMYQNSDGSVGYRYTNAGDAFVFSPISATRKIAPLYVDWATASDNSGNVKVEFLSNSITSIENNVILPVEYILYNNFPNPFNPSTTIKYQLPKSTYVSLKVFDILGNEIEIVEESYKSSGVHLVEFDGNNLPSGLYFYIIITKEYSEKKKMLLLK
jgi:hypothetical protein